MKPLFLFLTMLLLGVLARADDQVQAVQQALKDQGFYYGNVDGQPGPETDAAIRRYQIRQGLDVSGKLDAQTLASLNLEPSDTRNDGNTLHAVPPPHSDQSADAQQAAPAAEATPPPKVVQDDHDFLRSQAPATAQAPPPDEDSAPPSQRVEPAEPVQPPDADADAGQTLPPQYARFLRKTPYETAPPVVQRSTVERAQERLARLGFYRGIVDGQVSDSFVRALAAYQRDGDLPVTGRLDMDTLSDMDLLPRRHVLVNPPLPYQYYNAPPDSRDVYRGIWVR